MDKLNENKYWKLFKYLVAKKMLNQTFLLKLERAKKYSQKIQICNSLLEKINNGKNVRIASLTFDDYLKTIENENILNDRIKAKISILPDFEKIKHCEKLFLTKKAILILQKQCLQLRTRFTYDIKFVLSNLDKVDYGSILGKIETNIKHHNSRLQLQKKSEIKLAVEDDWLTQNSIKAILTPMYS